MEIDRNYLGMLTLVFFCFSSYSLPVSFYPLLAIRQEISSKVISFILASFTIGGILISIYLGKAMSKYGKRFLIGTSVGALGIIMLLFTILEFIPQKTIFIGYSIFVRTLHGISFGIIISIAYAYIPLLYPGKIQERIVPLQIMFGVSISFGAFVGENLYRIGGFAFPFIVFAAIYFLILYPSYCFLPPDDWENDQQLNSFLGK